jgi:hypothetical protein
LFLYSRSCRGAALLPFACSSFQARPPSSQQNQDGCST